VGIGQKRVKSTQVARAAMSKEELREIPNHKLEAVLGDNLAAAQVRKERLFIANTALPTVGGDFDAATFYDQVYGTNCENVVGFLPIPVGVIGPLTVNGDSYTVPMATTEGALLASANRGARAIREAGGSHARVLRDGMTRSPCLGFNSASKAADFAAWIEKSSNFDQLQTWFCSTTNFGKLKSVKPSVAGRYCFLRFEAFTGDAMGMNMVGKGVNAIVEQLLAKEREMTLVSLSGNMCTDKKPSASNWVNGRGKSVVCEVLISSEVVQKVLKTTVADLVQLNISKNLVGSALAGSIGGNNAHAANIVTAVFLATGQDPAQNVESSNCMVLMESINDGELLHASVTMPSIECGTIGGGTTLPAQRACLEQLGVAGAHASTPGENARKLSQIICASVLAGELSLNAALSSNHLISAHMALNRK